MIKAQELRIGNIISSQSNLRKQVTVLQLFSDSYQADFGNGNRGSMMYSTAEGIPLTSEWLERFGFKWYDEGETNYDWGYKIGEFKISEMEFGDEEKEYHFQPEDIQINTVHQLQNLYFALTGSELQLKERQNGIQDIYA